MTRSSIDKQLAGYKHGHDAESGAEYMVVELARACATLGLSFTEDGTARPGARAGEHIVWTACQNMLSIVLRDDVAAYLAAKHPGPLLGIRAMAAATDLLNADVSDDLEGVVTNVLLIGAAREGSLHCVKAMTQSVADSQCTCKRNEGTALMYGAANGHADVVQCLLETRADVKKADQDGRTALHLAVLANDHGSVRALIDRKADVDVCDNHGRTPLMIARRTGSARLVAALDAAGAHEAVGNLFGSDDDQEEARPLPPPGAAVSSCEVVPNSARQTAVDAGAVVTPTEPAPPPAVAARAADAPAAVAQVAPASSSAAATSPDMEQRKAALSSSVERQRREIELAEAALLAEEEREKAAAAKKAEKKARQAEKAAANRLRQAEEAAAAKRAKEEAAARKAAAKAAEAERRAAAKAEAARQREAAAAEKKRSDMEAAATAKARAKAKLDAAAARAAQHEAESAQQPRRGSSNGAGPGVGDEDGEEKRLREEWLELVDEANCCRDPSDQERLRQMLVTRIEAVQQAGISARQGKKALQRLTDVGPARQALEAAVASGELTALRDAVARGKKCRTVLPEGLYEQATEAVDELTLTQAERDDKRMMAHVLATSGGQVAGGGAARDAAPGPSSSDDGDECSVCMDAEAVVVCIPCMHKVLCRRCEALMKEDAARKEENLRCPQCQIETTILV